MPVHSPFAIQKPPVGAQVDWSHPLASRLGGLWALNEGSGLRVLDLVSGNTGQFTAAPIWVPKWGKSVKFNGSTQYIVMPTFSTYQGGNAVSLEAWCSLITASGTHCPAGLFGSSSDKGYWINIQTAGNGCEFLGSSTGSNQISSGTGKFSATSGALTHLVGTFDGTGLRLYANGKLVAGPASLTGPIHTVTTASAFAIGRLGAANADYMDDTVFKVSIYQKTLRPEEVMWLYEEPFSMLRSPDVWRRYYYSPTISTVYTQTNTGILTSSGSIVRQVSKVLGGDL